jgi:hypothetical protein
MKKIIVLMVMAAMMATFTACGNSHDNREKISDGPFGGIFGGGVYVTHGEVQYGEIHHYWKK